jgi:transketolase
MTVVAPADHRQARAAIESTWDLPGPIYYRLGKDDKSVVSGLHGRFGLGRAETIREGGDVLLVAMGAVATEAAAAAKQLATRGVEATVMIVASVNPAPVEDLAVAAGRMPLVVTVEAHSVNGGVGSLVAETIADRGLGCRLIRCGVRTTPDGRSGSTDYYHRLHGLDAAAVSETVMCALKRHQFADVRHAA